MCGIAGILRIHPAGQPAPAHWESIPEAWLDILDESIKHRGPDGAGRFRDRVVRADGSTVDVALVHRRLSIIDHACGHQPMVSLAKGEGVIPVKTYALSEGLGLYEPGEYERIRAATVRERVDQPHDLVAVVFNGCIYNHRELRKELLAAGHVFSTDHSDTEVLVHGWREWGRDLPGRLEGMFALALWDRHAGTLFWARDFAGEKPLYLSKERSGLDVVFAPTVAALLRTRTAMGTPIRSRPDDIFRWTDAGYGCAFIEGVRSLPPRQWRQTGCWEGELVLHENQHLPGSWSLRQHDGPALTPDRADALLRAAVERRLESDVPLAGFLSGGVDSSLVALHAHRARGSLHTLCVRMPDPRYDESAIAADVAAKIGATHDTLDVDPAPAADLVRLIGQIGEPLGDSSLLPTHWVSRAARDHARVCLSGDGGDELFCGYERYVAAARIHNAPLLRAAARLVPRSLLSQRSPKSPSAKLARLAAALRTSRPFEETSAVFPRDDAIRLVARPWPMDGRALKFKPDQLPGREFDTYLPDDLLLKVDAASMAVALEVRAPMLDRSLAIECLRAPLSSLMPSNQRKGLLRQVARKYFPPEIVDRPKMGFAIPIGEWFRSNHGGMRDLLMDHLNSAEPFGPPSLGIELNMSFIRQMLKEHDDAGKESIFPWKGRDHSQRLYMVLVLSIWAKWLGSL